jgi:hypothetical protein
MVKQFGKLWKAYGLCVGQIAQLGKVEASHAMIIGPAISYQAFCSEREGVLGPCVWKAGWQ